MNEAIIQYSDVFLECTEITVSFLFFISALGFISNIFRSRIFTVRSNVDSSHMPEINSFTNIPKPQVNSVLLSSARTKSF